MYEHSLNIDAQPKQCPECRAEVIEGPQECYQTLSEHVCSPNAPARPRYTWICANPPCAMHRGGIGEDTPRPQRS